jgi:hypothetical protein
MTSELATLARTNGAVVRLAARGRRRRIHNFGLTAAWIGLVVVVFYMFMFADGTFCLLGIPAAIAKETKS